MPPAAKERMIQRHARQKFLKAFWVSKLKGGSAFRNADHYAS
jgi:hypothetical protein